VETDPQRACEQKEQLVATDVAVIPTTSAIAPEMETPLLSPPHRQLTVPDHSSSIRCDFKRKDHKLVVSDHNSDFKRKDHQPIVTVHSSDFQRKVRKPIVWDHSSDFKPKDHKPIVPVHSSDFKHKGHKPIVPDHISDFSCDFKRKLQKTVVSADHSSRIRCEFKRKYNTCAIHNNNCGYNNKGVAVCSSNRSKPHTPELLELGYYTASVWERLLSIRAKLDYLASVDYKLQAALLNHNYTLSLNRSVLEYDLEFVNGLLDKMATQTCQVNDYKYSTHTLCLTKFFNF
jgi:hypothetical protein